MLLIRNRRRGEVPRLRSKKTRSPKGRRWKVSFRGSKLSPQKKSSIQQHRERRTSSKSFISGARLISGGKAMAKGG